MKSLLRRNCEGSLAEIVQARCCPLLRHANPVRDTTIAAHVGQTSLEQDPAERPSEVLVEDGINHGIQHRVHVTQPEGYSKSTGWDITNWTSWSQDVQEEERKPTSDKTAHNET